MEWTTELYYLLTSSGRYLEINVSRPIIIAWLIGFVPFWSGVFVLARIKKYRSPLRINFFLSLVAALSGIIVVVTQSVAHAYGLGFYLNSSYSDFSLLFLIAFFMISSFIIGMSTVTEILKSLHSPNLLLSQATWLLFPFLYLICFTMVSYINWLSGTCFYGSGSAYVTVAWCADRYMEIWSFLPHEWNLIVIPICFLAHIFIQRRIKADFSVVQ